MSSSAADRRPRPLRALLADSLARLAREAPGHHARLCHALRGRAIDLELDGDAFALSGGAHSLELGPPRGTACHLRTDTAALCALIRGELTLEGAVLAERVALGGPLDELLTFHEALLEYLHGAVRSPTFLELRDELVRRRMRTR